MYSLFQRNSDRSATCAERVRRQIMIELGTTTACAPHSRCPLSALAASIKCTLQLAAEGQKACAHASKLGAPGSAGC